MAEIWLTSIDGTLRLPVYQIGPYGAWGDLTYTTRWGDGACGMYEAQWTMPLAGDFDHPLLRRGTLVEITDGPWRIGSPLIMSEPAKGAGLADPWQFTATGIGREVEGANSYHAQDGTTGDTTAVPSVAVDRAIAAGWPIGGRDTSVPTFAIGGSTTTDELQTIGSLLNAVNDQYGSRWLVNQANLLTFGYDPTTPTYLVTPSAVALGTSDDNYASTVYVRYLNSATGAYATVASDSPNVRTRFGRREYLVNLTGMVAMPQATAQAFSDGILARSKGRLAWTNSLTLTSNELLTTGGVPASLSKVAEDVGNGCMIRLNGINNDLLEYNGQTWLDIIIGEAKYVDGAQTIDLAPLGLAARDLASVVEEVTGYRDAA
jgi:hypothetical protein